MLVSASDLTYVLPAISVVSQRAHTLSACKSCFLSLAFLLAVLHNRVFLRNKTSVVTLDRGDAPFEPSQSKRTVISRGPSGSWSVSFDTSLSSLCRVTTKTSLNRDIALSVCFILFSEEKHHRAWVRLTILQNYLSLHVYHMTKNNWWWCF